MNNTTRTIATYACIALALTGGVLIGHSAGKAEGRNADITVQACNDTSTPPAYTFTGACMAQDGTLQPKHSLPSIPRCKSDDYNDGSQARCWTETVEGKILVISQDDQVIS